MRSAERKARLQREREAEEKHRPRPKPAPDRPWQDVLYTGDSSPRFIWARPTAAGFGFWEERGRPSTIPSWELCLQCRPDRACSAIHTRHENRASEVNQGGLEDQVEFLVERWGEAETMKAIEELV